MLVGSQRGSQSHCRLKLLKYYSCVKFLKKNMILLPKSQEDFAKTSFWNAFFKNRGTKAFEWYGEYLELCEPIHKYVKTNDKILMIGCGNSNLSMDMFDAGYKNMINIDISDVVVKNMQRQNAILRPDLVFLQMDATRMVFQDAEYTVAFDKGTLDALFINTSDIVISTMKSYLSEINRVLRIGGRYLCVTLLQEHILDYLLIYFPQNSFILRILHCRDVKQRERSKKYRDASHSMPVFMLIATKLKNLDSPILEFSYNNESIQRMKNIDELKTAVNSVQQVSLIRDSLVDSVGIALGTEILLDVCRPGETAPRYTFYILEQLPARKMSKYAAFIVPQGRETEWLFATKEGRKKLLSTVKYQRLIIVTLHRDQFYNSLDEVKSELSDGIKQFAPRGLEEQIPFLSLGSDVGQRDTLFCGYSKISGKFLVEEITCDNSKILRRIIFLNNPSVIQSEALIKVVITKDQETIKRINYSFLACQHHLYMSIGIKMAISLATEEQPTLREISPSSSLSTVASLLASNDHYKKVLVIGLGGGCLCSFLHKTLPDICIIAIEIDRTMLEIAEKYFELKTDERMHVLIDDGLVFLEKCKIEGLRFDAILFDVDNKDLSLGMSCPPVEFLHENVLSNIQSIIGSNGLFILNLVCRNEELRTKAINDLTEKFPSIYNYKLSEDINEVIYCTNNKFYTNSENWRTILIKSAKYLNEAMKTITSSNNDVNDIEEIIKELKI